MVDPEELAEQRQEAADNDKAAREAQAEKDQIALRQLQTDVS